MSKSSINREEVFVTLPSGRVMTLISYIREIQMRAQESATQTNRRPDLDTQDVRRYVEHVISMALSFVAQEAIQLRKNNKQKQKQVCIADDIGVAPLNSSQDDNQCIHKDNHIVDSGECSKGRWRQLVEQLLPRTVWFLKRRHKANKSHSSSSDFRRKSDSAIHDEYEFSDDAMGSEDVTGAPEVHSCRLLSSDSGVEMDIPPPANTISNDPISRFRNFLTHLVSCRHQ